MEHLNSKRFILRDATFSGAFIMQYSEDNIIGTKLISRMHFIAIDYFKLTFFLLLFIIIKVDINSFFLFLLNVNGKRNLIAKELNTNVNNTGG